MTRLWRAIRAFERSPVGEALGLLCLFVLLWMALWAGAVLS